MKIGEISKLFNIPRETLRFYEKEGLMTPPNRNDNNYRSYSENHIKRLRFIKNCRSLNMS
ncbi:MerR family transcriptional regulator, partial [Providencia huaxiensis]